jgi:tetratricopeptide (TPR) repeat protein
VAWREPLAAFAGRNLGLACIAVGERDHIPQYFDQALRLLASEETSHPQDHAVLTGLGVVYLRKGRANDAARMFRQAVESQPGAAAYHGNLATALAEAGDSETAIRHLNSAIELDPSLEVAYRRLVEVYSNSHRGDLIDDVFRRYLKFRPQSLAAREAIGIGNVPRTIQ